MTEPPSGSPWEPERGPSHGLVPRPPQGSEPHVPQGPGRTTALRVLAFVSGTLSILLGLFCFRRPMQSILLLALWTGIGWLFRGITQILAAAHDPAMPVRGRQIFLGALTVVGGIVLIDAPFESVAVLTLVGGCWLLAVGAVETVTALPIRGRSTPSERISQPVG